ncbi:MAG: UDP-N-acetylglucosamine pyrophosphorylase [Clostridia bacterium]|nr:UDP-N-acetylglucosamine pyrophosphorylase [Clostridia bacterium]
MDAIRITDLYDLTHTRAADMLAGCQYPWEALDLIEETVRTIGASLSKDVYDEVQEGVWIARSAVVFPTATILPPAIIGENTEVRPGAFIRGSVLVGDGAVVGNSTELKNCILFDAVQVPHYNYVGDSILGYKAHMGAGAITSNVKGDQKDVVIRGESLYPTGRMKCGAMLGDHAEIGCGSVLNPGTVIGRQTQVYPLSSVRGVVPAKCIVKGERGVFAKEGCKDA